jgi:hypothetical protein
MSITRAQIATQLLNEMAPKGEKLAYINNREAELLKRMGGAGKNINETGIKSYYYDEVGQTMGGTGFQDTSHLTGGSGDGGGGSYDYIPQPPMAQVKTDPIKGGDNIPAWAKHAMTTLAMRGSLNKPAIRNYGFQTGADFQLNFPNLDPRVTAVLASGYQLGQEGLRSLNPFGGNFLDFKGAFNTAQESAAKNIEGALAADLNVLSPEEIASGREYAESVGINDNVYINKARGGRVNYANGGRGYNNMSITRAQIATQLLNEMAPKGEKLAYINNREAELLKRMGGAGVDINKTGIKSYFDPGSGRGSVSESLNQAAFGSSGPTFSSDGESGSFTPKGNFATITKDGGGGNDQPITEIRPNFNYNIDPSLIDPRLNFKNKIEAIIYLQEFLDKQAKGEDVDLEADINFRDQLGNLDIFGNYGRSGNIVGANIPFLQSGLASLAYSPDTGLAAGLRGNLTEDLSGGVSFQDGQQNVNFNYNKGPFSADFTKNPEGYDARFGVNYKFAKGGRIGYQMGGIGAMPMIAETPSDVEGQLSDFDLYSTLKGKEGMRFGENPLGIMEAAQRFSKGGEVRQAYGLGKLVKKITKPIQKVVKSDLGKAALTAAAAYYAPALLGKSGYISGANPLFSATGKGGITDFLIKKGLSAKNYLRNLTGIGLPPGAKSTMSPTKRILTALGIGATASPFFMGGEEEDEETLDQAIARAYGKSDLDIPGIRRAALGYSDPNELYFKLPSAYRLNAAEGGITSMDVDDLPMSKEGSPKYYNPEGEEISFKEFEEAMKKEKQIMPKKKPSRTKKAEGGLMNLGGNEMDLRGGGFVPLGAKEKADDVPARLSKNEFVFTADAVRAAGGGSIEKGAQKMYNTMKQLENMI